MTKQRGNPKFDIRVRNDRRAQWQRAADIEQRTLSDFIKIATDEKTNQVLIRKELK
jgi:uncharacterized protein (DUF1778 family)